MKAQTKYRSRGRSLNSPLCFLFFLQLCYNFSNLIKLFSTIRLNSGDRSAVTQTVSVSSHLSPLPGMECFKVHSVKVFKEQCEHTFRITKSSSIQQSPVVFHVKKKTAKIIHTDDMDSYQNHEHMFSKIRG